MIRAELDFSICASVVPERLVLVLTQEQLKKAVWQKVIAQTRLLYNRHKTTAHLVQATVITC